MTHHVDLLIEEQEKQIESLQQRCAELEGLLTQLDGYMSGSGLWSGGWFNHPETPSISPSKAVAQALTSSEETKNA